MSLHEAIDAVPLDDDEQVDKSSLRNVLIKRTAYILADSEDPASFNPLDEETGSLPYAIGWRGHLYFLDGDDFVSEGDDANVIETVGGYRYIREGFSLRGDAVVSRTVDEPPAAEDIDFGNAWLVPPGSSGEWGDHADEIAIWTPRGWRYIAPRVGLRTYVEAEDVFVVYNSSGEWISDVERQAQSIRASMMLGSRTHWVVVNQTTDAPPTLTGSGAAYIAGGAPSGAWDGQSTKILVDEGTAWGLYTPAEGWTAYDQATNKTYVWNGAAWESQTGAIIKWTAPTITRENVSHQTIGSGAFVYSSIPPTTSQLHRRDDVGVAHAARVSGAKLRVHYSARIIGSNANHTFAIALLRDSEPNAVDHKWASWGGSPVAQVNEYFDVAAIDAESHTYKVAFFAISSSGMQITALDTRSINILESAT